MRTELPSPSLGSFRHRDANARDALNANSTQHGSIPSPTSSLTRQLCVTPNSRERTEALLRGDRCTVDLGRTSKFKGGMRVKAVGMGATERQVLQRQRGSRTRRWLVYDHYDDGTEEIE